MPQEKRLKVGLVLQGSLAEAMLQERRRTLASNAAITRAALVEYFRRKGYDVRDETAWGGYREPEEEEQGQEVAVVATMP